ncbi:unnamed protein product [Phytomonas sp. Hart1]|nr:unnamed protein product [Phytomonas sp. Hart1]|eukprot:CCW71802.1 unnamed protein product [Phytomonas sp. isolate Hart1]
MWLGAGIGYYRSGNPIAAEACLNESNVCNPLNPRTWAFLALLCMRTNPEQVGMLFEQTQRHGLSDAVLWAELGCEMLITINKPTWSLKCLQRALSGKAIPHRGTIHTDEAEETPSSSPAPRDLNQGEGITIDDSKSTEALGSIRNVSGNDTYTSGTMQGSSVLPPSMTNICLYYLSHALLRLNRVEEARKALTRVIRDSTNDVLKAKAEVDLKHCV